MTTDHLQQQNNDSINTGYITKLQNLSSKIADIASKRPLNDIKSEETSHYQTNNLNGYSKAFVNYLRYGSEEGLRQFEQKSANLSILSKRDAGYAVTERMNGLVYQELYKRSSLRQLANTMKISTDALEVLQNDDEIQSGWFAEEVLDATNKTKSLTLKKQRILVHQLFAEPKAPQNLIEDTEVDVETWLANKLSEEFFLKENEAFISGDGIAKPKGILAYADAISAIPSGSATGITSDSLLTLYYSLEDKYLPNAKFLVSKEAMHSIRMLKDKNGRYLWEQGLQYNGPDKLFGCDVMISMHMPQMKEGALPIIFGDFNQGYQIVDREDIRILRDPFTHKPYVKFYTTKRVGGDVVDCKAFRLMKVSL